ncbi:MAG: DevA family ABC transporter ATP-binding protein [Aphanocapsa lilacina HA4352-LM1]|jgi:putative ABC transport system ATP-binding protein|nr:DevA family ABC transporter ATP-binding protein [Aphanocapsa lilacina HA4352-LM1]
MSLMPVIAIRRLDHTYGHGALERRVLSDIDLTIAAGELVILTGPSGSGKTTLLTLIGALRSPQTGSLRVLGQELCGASEADLVAIRRNIGYIFQSHNLLGFLTARQNVQMAAELSAGSPTEARALSEAILVAVGLSERLDYYPENLSGGQKQRVAIARALVNRPSLVLADEPTAALDSKSGREVVELMQQLAADQGCAILMVTHDSRILDVATRTVHMEDGRLVQSETAVRA